MISVTILTKDVGSSLKATLDALIKFPEIIILDNGSSDDTLEIAAAYDNVVIHHHPFVGFGRLHNIAVDYASHDWILSIDADEVVSEELAETILQMELKKETVYEIGRLNFFRGKAIKCCGWYPEYVSRLFFRKTTRFSLDEVHERVLTDGLSVKRLPYPLYHYSYHSISDFLRKMEIYSSLFAQQNCGKKESSLRKALWKSWFTFFRSYIVKRGFLGGAEGLLIAKYNADVAFYKYAKLAHKNEDERIRVFKDHSNESLQRN